MNLIEERWLRVTALNGEQQISPLEVGDVGLLDIVALRPDFRGASYQLLIGLLQLAYAPRDVGQWRERYASPPSREALAEAFAPYTHAFVLHRDGSAFMQDFALVEEANTLSVAELLIDAGSDSNLYFNKPVDAPGFCQSCFAQGLFALQINAPSGGRGIRTSLRGGGPLTTLLLPADKSATLWQKLWLNVLPQDALGYPAVTDLGDVLPWMKATRISEGAAACDTTPETVHPLQAWWSMPRRIRIDPGTVQAHGVCSLCGAQDVPLIRHYRHRHGGTNYTGTWQHPLTPYYLDKKGEKSPISSKGHQAGRGYRDWLGLVLGTEDQQPAAARVVSHFNTEVRQPDVLLWCFGYATSNMKALCWYDSTLPVHALAPELLQPFTRSVKQLLDAADEIAEALSEQVKKAWFKELKNKESGNKEKKEKKTAKQWKETKAFIQQSFWQTSEPLFYRTLARLVQHDFESRAALAQIYRQWLQQAYAQVLELFDQWALAAPPEDLDMRSVVEARVHLTKKLNNSQALKPLWELVNQQQKKAQAKGRSKEIAA